MTAREVERYYCEHSIPEDTSGRYIAIDSEDNEEGRTVRCSSAVVAAKARRCLALLSVDRDPRIGDTDEVRHGRKRMSAVNDLETRMRILTERQVLQEHPHGPCYSSLDEFLAVWPAAAAA